MYSFVLLSQEVRVSSSILCWKNSESKREHRKREEESSARREKERTERERDGKRAKEKEEAQEFVKGFTKLKIVGE
ncbi:unnamed protein product [Camellia sinensis]